MPELYTYAVSRIHAKEAGLLNKTDIEQLLAVPSAEEALRLLTEKGYGSGEEYSGFSELKAAETVKLRSFIDELYIDKKPLGILLRQTDFHNLKTAVKLVYTAEKADGYFLENGSVSPEVILEAVKLKDFSELPPFMTEAAQKAADGFSENGDGQLLDIYLDRVCLETMLREAADTRVGLIIEYTEMFAALTNIKAAVRCALTKKSRAFIDEALAECGTLDAGRLAAAASSGLDEIYKYLEFTDYKAAVDELKISLSEFEKWMDNRLVDLIKSQKSNPFTIAPVFAYILAKRTELRTVQIIMSGKRNSLSEDVIRERIRDLYV